MYSSHRLVCCLLTGSAFVFCLACDGDRPTAPPPQPRDASQVAPAADGGGDASVSNPDGGGDASTLDSGLTDAGDVGTDASGDDAGSAAWPTCRIPEGSGTFTIAVDSEMGERVVQLSAGNTSFLVTWKSVIGARSDLFGWRMESSGASDGDPVRLTDDSGRELEVVSHPLSSGGWLLAYVSNAMREGYEVHVATTDATVSMPSDAQLVTNTPTLREDSLDLIAAGEGYLLSWIEEDPSDVSSRHIKTRRLNASGVPTAEAEVASLPGQGIQAPQLWRNPSAVFLVYANASTGQLLSQPLDERGGRSGEPLRIDVEGGVDGGFDVASRGDGGAAVFSVNTGLNTELRFRALSESGAPSGSERVLSDEYGGNSPSIAAFAGGYVVSYRIRNETGDGGALQMLFVDSEGEVLTREFLAPIGAEGGRTTVRVSSDGHLFVTWAETGASSTALLGLLLRCGEET